MSEPLVNPEQQPLVRFDGFMERCLYGRDGFYATVGRAGRRGGDFVTSPEVGPLFGEVVAKAIDHWWAALGSPSDFTVYDVGCGPGALLRSVRRSRPDRPWNLIGVDIAASALAAEPNSSSSTGTEIQVLPELPNNIEGAVVLGNEVLDNMPFRIIEKVADGLNEVFVKTAGSEGESTVTEVLAPYSPPTDERSSTVDFDLSALTAELPIGTRLPLLNDAGRWVEATLARKPARLCLFDYGAATTAELALRGGWLRTYRQHERGGDPYDRPGSCDITTDVPTDQLPDPSSVSTQAEFLQQWGIAELVAEGKANWQANAHAPNVAALKMRSRVSESEALLDPGGLGVWNVLQWGS